MVNLASNFPPRKNAIAVALDNKEILLCGGKTDTNECMGDIYIINTNELTLQCMKMNDNKFLGFNSYDNQCRMLEDGKIVGLVQDANGRINIFSYNSGDTALKVLDQYDKL